MKNHPFAGRFGARASRSTSMRLVLSSPLARVLPLFAALGGSVSAAQYRQDYAAFDGGGGSSSSANYSMVTSLVSVGGAVLTGGVVALRPGFIGQINDPPRPRTDLLYRAAAVGVKTRVATLLENDVDPEGGPLTWVGFVATTPNGGHVLQDGDWLMYDPAGLTVGDQFAYVVADAEGDRAIGWASVSVVPPDAGPTRNLLGITPLPSGELRMDFIGIPRRWYRIEGTAALDSGQWVMLGRVQADARGLSSFTDVNQGGARFYRAIAE